MKLINHLPRLEEIAASTGFKLDDVTNKYNKIWKHLYDKHPGLDLQFYLDETLKRTSVYYEAQIRMRDAYTARHNQWINKEEKQ
jgi:hypothetical protein